MEGLSVEELDEIFSTRCCGKLENESSPPEQNSVIEVLATKNEDTEKQFYLHYKCEKGI